MYIIAVPARSREVTVAFNFISECNVESGGGLNTFHGMLCIETVDCVTTIYIRPINRK
jgi:hypothetical protein